MPTVLTETDTYATTVSGPSAGDAVNAATMRSQMTDLNNRLFYLKKRLIGLDQQTIQVPVVAGIDAGAGRFSFALLGARLGAVQYNVGGADGFVIPLALPTHIATYARWYIESLTAQIFVDTGRGSLPTTFPKIHLRRQAVDGATGYTTPLTFTIPTPGSVGAYEAGGQTTTSGSAGTASTTPLTTQYHYWAHFEGETGGGAMANKLALLGATVSLAAV